VRLVDNKELAKEYKAALKLINDRIAFLKTELSGLDKDKHLSEYEKKIRTDELKDRLRPLNSMQRDLRGVHVTIKNYYKRGWWRSEDYTCNQRKARRTIFYFGNFSE
jgi:hypothetical protein